VLDQLVTAGTASGLSAALAQRIVRRALNNGTCTPLPAPPTPRNGCRVTR